MAVVRALSFFVLSLNLPGGYKVQYISLITNICPLVESPSVRLQLDCVCCDGGAGRNLI